MALWYYAKEDQQHGPISDQEIQSLISSGKVGPADEVWRDGMDDWRPAGEVPELFAERPVAPPPMPSAPGRRAGIDLRSVLRWLDVDLLQWARPLGQWLLVGGFLLVIASKGCDAVGKRYADRLKSQATLATREFNYEYDLRQSRLELEREEINSKSEISNYDQQRLESIDESLVELREDRDNEQRRLRRTTWQRMQHSADTADANQQQWALFHTMAFVLGSMVLVVGLLIVGLSSQGAPSWLCLGILAIIAFSLYVGGAAWMGALLP